MAWVSSSLNVYSTRLADLLTAAITFCTLNSSRVLSFLIGLPAEKLPSTSAANAAWSFARLVEAYRVIADALKTHVVVD